MSISLNIFVQGQSQFKTYYFDPHITIEEVSVHIAKTLSLDHTQFGLLLRKENDFNWLKKEAKLNECLSEIEIGGVQIHFCKRHRPIRILMKDGTFRTHLTDDSLMVSEIIEEICCKFGVECALNISSIPSDQYEILELSQTLREQGYQGDIRVGLSEATNRRPLGLFIQVPQNSGELSLRINNAWKKRFAIISKKIFSLYKDKNQPTPLQEYQVTDFLHIKEDNKFNSSTKSKKTIFIIQLKNQEVLYFSCREKAQTSEWVQILLIAKEMYTSKVNLFSVPAGYRSVCAAYRHSRVINVPGDKVLLHMSSSKNLLDQTSPHDDKPKRFTSLKKISRLSNTATPTGSASENTRKIERTATFPTANQSLLNDVSQPASVPSEFASSPILPTNPPSPISTSPSDGKQNDLDELTIVRSEDTDFYALSDSDEDIDDFAISLLDNELEQELRRNNDCLFDFSHKFAVFEKPLTELSPPSVKSEIDNDKISNNNVNLQSNSILQSDGSRIVPLVDIVSFHCKIFVEEISSINLYDSDCILLNSAVIESNYEIVHYLVNCF